MIKTTSIYLDLLRISAAFGVLFVHANLSWFSENKFLHESYGHKLVMIFFVLSGFLVAYTTDSNKKDLRNYLIDRSSRLYSVVIPALIFTYLIDNFGNYINPGFYEGQLAKTGQWWRAVLNLTFLQQHWFLCTKPSSNGTFWSIAYEFWYYILFGIYYYINNRVYKSILIIICLLFIGIKIILLLPVWILGVISYQWSKTNKMSQIFSWVGFISTAILILFFTLNNYSSPLEDRFPFGLPPLYFSSRFIFDYGYGLLIAMHIYFASHISIKLIEESNNKSIIKLIRNISGTTFTLYLFHLPFLIFAAAVIPYNHNDKLHLWAIVGVIYLLTWFLSIYIEQSRYWYKKYLSIIINLKLTSDKPFK